MVKGPTRRFYYRGGGGGVKKYVRIKQYQNARVSHYANSHDITNFRVDQREKATEALSRVSGFFDRFHGIRVEDFECYRYENHGHKCRDEYRSEKSCDLAVK